MRCQLVSYVWLALGPTLCAYAEAAWPLQPSAHTWDGRTNESIGGARATTGRNLLYIISDDLRSELGRVHLQPSFQKLLGKSMLFDRTFVQQAVCNPSRQSFLTARRPDTTGVWNMKAHLLSLVRPMPIGVSSTDLESFRRSLYTEVDAKTDADKKLQTPCIRCDWCGIWTPLPERQLITANIAEISGIPLEHSLESKLEELDSVVDKLLEACLCQSSTQVDAIIDIEGYLFQRSALNTERFTAAEASEQSWNRHGKPGLKKYCFKRFHPAVEDPNPVTKKE